MATEASREKRARRRAQAQGLALHKSRVLAANSDDQGGWMIVNDRNVVLAGHRFDLTLDEVERFLEEGP